MSSGRPVAIVVAMEEEFLPFRRLVPDLRPVRGCGPWELFEGTAGARRVVIVVSDCGPANAAAACGRRPSISRTLPLNGISIPMAVAVCGADRTY